MLLDLSGTIMYDVPDWMSEVVNVILGGELYNSVMSTQLKHHASHHDHSVTRHVPAIQKDADISHY
jgi:hypothetical protein